MRVGATELVWLVILVILPLIANWNIYKKMGEPGWKGIIPYYNTYVLCKHVWKTSIFWWIAGLSVATVVLTGLGASSLLISLLGLAQWILSIGITIKEGDAFRKGVGFIIGMIFLPFIFKLILAFGSAEFSGQAAPIEQNKTELLQ
jgi:hypothetical protein